MLLLINGRMYISRVNIENEPAKKTYPESFLSIKSMDVSLEESMGSSVVTSIMREYEVDANCKL